MRKAIIICIGSILFGCRDIDNCDSDSSQPFMIVQFFDILERTPKQIGFQVRSVTREQGTFLIDSTFYRNDSTVLLLLLNPEDTTLTVEFDSIDSPNDFELQIRYDREFSIFDPECPPAVSFVNIDTLRSTFDSTVVVGSITDRQLSNNIEVYF